jgi:Tfp pilus assembly PilM family ATPase
MKRLPPISGDSLFLEIRQNTLRALHGQEALSFPLERSADGRLTPDCKQKLQTELHSFVNKTNWKPRAQTICAIDARGVSLRRLSLPVSSNDELERLLHLQIEREFPLAPNALAWGASRVNAESANGKQELVVAAVKKEVVEDYAQLLTPFSAAPVFTVAALARSRICPPSADSFGLLDIGRKHSELLIFNQGMAESLRILPWGGENITRALEKELGVNFSEAEALKLKLDDSPAANGNLSISVQAALSSAVGTLATAISKVWTGNKLLLTGSTSRSKVLPQRLAEQLGCSVESVQLKIPPGNFTSAALIGMAQEDTKATPPLLLLRPPNLKNNGSAAASAASRNPAVAAILAEGRSILGHSSLRTWARLAILLGLLALCFPLIEALALKPFLARRVASVNREKGRLEVIDRELTFLQSLKKSQPPFLDVLYVLADSASPGTRFDSVALTRRGELSLKGNLRDGQQVADLRSKLLKSGFFSVVTVEEQTPSPDRQKVTVRITAALKPAGSRPPLSETVPTNAPLPDLPSFPFPGMGGPPPMAMNIPGPEMGAPPSGIRAPSGPGPSVTRPPMSTPGPRRIGSTILVDGVPTAVSTDTNSAAASSDPEKKEKKE